MTVHRLALAALLFLPVTAMAEDNPEPLVAGATSEGAVTLDLDSIKERVGPRAGRRKLKADIELAKPYHYAAHEVTRERQTQEWDCDGFRYRVTLREYFTSSGQYVESRLGYGPWKDVPKDGADWAAFETLCPAQAALED